MRIVILPLYGFGDVLMSTPALRNLKEQTGAHIAYLHMFTTTRDILIGNPYVDENIHFPFLDASRLEGIRFLLRFRKKFDASINFYPSNRKDYNMAAFIIGAPLRLGHRYVLRDIREWNFLKNRTLREDDGLHNVEEDLRLLDFLGIGQKTPYPLEIYLSDDERHYAEGWLKERNASGRPILGLHPGSSVFKAHTQKRWPGEKFAPLLRKLGALYPDLLFFLFGGKEEDPLKQELKETSGLGDRVVPVSVDTVRQTAAIMEHCKAFVTNDSGLMHLSAALQLPTVALFGPTNPRWLRPWQCSHKVIRHGDCPPCFRYSPIPQRCLAKTNFSCVREIPLEEVLEAVVSFLG